MTHITFFRNDGIFYGFEERGHAGCGQFGNDPVCAMISSLTMYIVDAVEDVYGGKIRYDINDDDTVITVRSPSALPAFEPDERVRFAVSGLFLTYYHMLEDMLLHDDLYEFGEEGGVEIEVKDLEYEE
ncbi:MAG: ribosomal-processing cysteine protease Prp [Clostridia bacterium]|nr:ribosomal-processing cysteine protease Prp [Clostridia bacterium]MDD7700433.1 ribosomal-processing cysteine protease Prp [Eubacteriales bacterium]MDY2827313.1 ribosomal-processing cysteine protease Prp [Eubacteriales bacterium]